MGCIVAKYCQSGARSVKWPSQAPPGQRWPEEAGGFMGFREKARVLRSRVCSLKPAICLEAVSPGQDLEL